MIFLINVALWFIIYLIFSRFHVLSRPHIESPGELFMPEAARSSTVQISELKNQGILICTILIQQNTDMHTKRTIQFLYFICAVTW
jgi:hypothetical protein